VHSTQKYIEKSKTIISIVLFFCAKKERAFALSLII